jgi:hypothetical protein
MATMMIMLVILALALAILLAGVAALAVTVALGIGTASFRQTRLLSPIFLIIFPCTVLGALAGCFGLGYLLITRVDEHLLLWGPVLGLLVGTGVGALLGVLIAGFIWWWAWPSREARGAAVESAGE